MMATVIKVHAQYTVQLRTKLVCEVWVGRLWAQVEESTWIWAGNAPPQV